MVVRLLQSKKAQLPINKRVFDSFIDVRFVHPLKALSPMVKTPSSKTTDVKASQSSNACSPMNFTLPGIVMERSVFAHPVKALGRIYAMVLGSTIEVRSKRRASIPARI